MSANLTRCFALPKSSYALVDGRHNANGQRIRNWTYHPDNHPAGWQSEDQYALAHLIPLLLCGEQSAQLVFNQEITRLFVQDSPENYRMIKSLISVEQDEARHDQALQWVLQHLPVVAQQNKIQGQARLFYAKLGRGESRCQHFIKIATLDACVTQIMHALAHCLLGESHPFAVLCGLIKKDEAKHVYIAKRHAQALGATSAMFKHEQQIISGLLHQLLITQTQHFTALGVDLERVFNTLESKWQ
ncbi:hypothetical protein DS885_06315 [Psychromonas sp. B3M02]|uniref:hypothetical protein n=1 Tax=Psychromonas sp. B3M02 TaxID=2267226 RepID=UPI000DEB097E|nr:hypothetical protein [Psychromonas sp. B3M02]RBW46812.1 hypothetical protein DS885_06315 [Psychromonas sp. B3M02]